MAELSRRTLLEASAGGLGGALLGANASAQVAPRGEDEELRVGLVGNGLRGSRLLHSLGYPVEVEQVRRPANIRVVAVCDTFEDHRLDAAYRVERVDERPKAYIDYREMLAAEELDALVIATPDFSHAQIAMDAMRAGADVYVEKCMANTIQEALEMRRVRAETGRIIQVGYQLHQDEVHRLAAEYVQRGYIGEVRMAQCTLRRGGDQGGWLRDNARDGGPPREKIAWETFLAGIAPEVDYDPERYFEWRKFWDYGTGIAGDLLSHFVDEVAFMLELPAPTYGAASGGIYQWKGARETPDTFTCAFEYPDNDFQLNFCMTSNNSFPKQPVLLLGTEGTIAVSYKLEVYADRHSRKYERQIESGRFDPQRPILRFEDPAAARAQHAVPSQLWLAGRGATSTTRGGQEFDTSYLHLDEFLRCVRTREQPSANDSVAWGSTLACHLATQSYLQRRQVRWDEDAQAIV